MIKHITLKIIRWRLRNTLPKVNLNLYKKLFTLTYRFFIYLKPSQIWIIVLALLNKTDIKNLISIPSIFMLFSTIFSDSIGGKTSKLDNNLILAKLEINKLTDADNNWEIFFLILIILASIKRFTTIIFKFLWLPFKIVFIYYVLKYLGYDFSYIFNTLNNLSLGIIDWFYNKIINFFLIYFLIMITKIIRNIINGIIWRLLFYSITRINFRFLITNLRTQLHTMFLWDNILLLITKRLKF